MYKRSVFPSLYSLAAAALLAAAPPAAFAQALELAGAYRLAAENDPAFLAAGARSPGPGFSRAPRSGARRH